MNRLIASARSAWEPLKNAPGSLFRFLVLAGVGVLLGTQYVQPNKRVIAVMVAVVVLGIAWRLDMVFGLGVLVLSLPFPRGTVFGNTNVALILILLVIWLLRISQGQTPPPRRTPIDLPIVGFITAYIVSFYNVQNAHDLRYAFENFQLLVAGILMFYLIVSNVRSERDLRRLHIFQIVSLVTICLLALYELNNPGKDFIPGWISFRETRGDEFNLKNVRIGGPFFDYELLAEFSAISMFLVGFLLVRSRNVLERTTYTGLLLLTLFVLFATVTRGAVFSMFAALAYLLWIMRRRVQFVPLVILGTIGVTGFLLMNFYVATFTRSGDLLARLGETQFYGGIPDSRRTAWADGWERFLMHPLIGHGPYYAPQTGTRTWFWPHNGYLYIANLVGAIGLGMYLWIVGKLWMISRPMVDHLRHRSYARSFLLIAHMQLIVFIIDQIKIDFMRNEIYQFQIWILFASIVAAHQIARSEQLNENGNGTRKAQA